MSLPLSFAHQSIIRVRAALLPRDARGNQVRDWANAPEFPIEGCVVFPGATAELTAGRDSALIQFTVIAPAGADVLPTDRIKLPGSDRTYDIDGEPGRWPSPTGGVSSTVLLLKKWEG